MDIIFYGTGKAATFLNRLINEYYTEVNIVAFTNSSVESKGIFLGRELNTIENLTNSYDYVVVAIGKLEIYKEVRETLINKGICSNKILHYWDFINMLRKTRIIEKYLNSEDEQMKNTIEWLQNHELTVRNQYENTSITEYEVFYDETTGYPYVIYYGKRMYYPKDYNFKRKLDGRLFLTNIVECDQYDGSPHLYVKEGHMVENGDVVVDAGVAEGNFALKYIDIVDKVYLIESDPIWLEVLELTFKPYKDKVVVIPKMLGNNDTESETTLDTIIGRGKCDFIKMDIEGAEPNALLGSIDVLNNNNVKLSVCAYHNMKDEKYIKFILNALGYKISHSNGKMFFIYDEAIDSTLDFRNGVIYGEKNQDE